MSVAKHIAMGIAVATMVASCSQQGDSAKSQALGATGAIAIDGAPVTADYSNGFVSTYSAKISTSGANRILVAAVSTRTGSVTSGTVTGGGLTWHQAAAIGGATGATNTRAEVWWAAAPTQISGATITVSWNENPPAFGQPTILALSGARTDAIGNVAMSYGANWTTPPSVSVTGSTAGSWVIGAFAQDQCGVPSANSGDTILHALSVSGNAEWSERAASPSPGGTVTLSTSGGGCSPWNAAAIEILAAIPPNTTSPPTTPGSPSPAPTPAGLPATNPIGINIAAPLDYSQDRLYADLIRSSRDVMSIDGTTTLSDTSSVDADDYPLVTDFQITAFAGIDQMQGTYALSFTGRASSVTANGSSSVSGLAYNASTNTSTATVVVSDSGSTALALNFAGAYRDAATSHPGLVNLKLMRPVAPGSSTPFGPSVLFNTPLPAMVQPFSVIRYMDFTATNNNQQVNWSDRTLPARRTQSWSRPGGGYGWEGVGGSWEDVIRFANTVGRDAWICIPGKASDDYATKVAQLFAYGSDGVNPYTSPQANPIYPPLAPSLNLYVEYSNELWNGAFQQFGEVDAAASAEPSSSPIRYDGQSSSGELHARYVAMRSARISLIFRHVFGDAAMMTRVRPVLEGQSSWPTGPGGIDAMLRFAFGYMNNGDGNNVPNLSWLVPGTTTQVGPQPPSYYWYGGGGAAYYSPSSASSISAVLTTGEMNPATWVATGQLQDATAPHAFGLQRTAYEGGPNFGDWSGASENVNQPAADMTFRPSSPNMTDVVEAHHELWSQLGGDLLVYFTTTSDYKYGIAPISEQHPDGDIYDRNSPKLVALTELAAQAPAAVTAGTAIPGSVDGNAFMVSSRLWDTPGSGPRAFTAGSACTTFAWASYVFRSPEAAPRNVSLSLSNASGTVQVYWDGALLCSQPATTNVTCTTGVAGPGLHGVIVRAGTGAFSLNSLSIN